MQIYPAIDLRGGQCVRLRQGDYQQETVFGADPADMARRWVDDGATYLHLVDLDGAKVGRPVNDRSIRAIVEVSGIPCQLGGGLRTRDDIARRCPGAYSASSSAPGPCNRRTGSVRCAASFQASSCSASMPVVVVSPPRAG